MATHQIPGIACRVAILTISAPSTAD